MVDGKFHQKRRNKTKWRETEKEGKSKKSIEEGKEKGEEFIIFLLE